MDGQTSRDNNLGMWSTGPNDGGTGSDSGPDYTDDMSGSSVPLLPSTSTFLSLLIALSCLLFYKIPLTLL